MITIETPNVRERLVELIQLQVLYNRLHALEQRKGDLPQQIEDLQDKIAALQLTSQGTHQQIQQCEAEIRTLHTSNNSLRDHEQKLQKLLLSVRNEQEYYKIESDLKEARLTIEKNLKDIQRLQQRVMVSQHKHEEELTHMAELQRLIAEKQENLDKIILRNKQQEEDLRERIQILSEHVQREDARLFHLFDRRRQSLRGGSALVSAIPLEGKEDRVICSGCYTLLPRQLQWQLYQRNTILICENCGRLLVDAALFEEVAASMP